MTYQLPGQIAPFTIHCTIIIMYRSLIYCPLKQWWRISKSYQMEKFEKFLRGHGRVKWKWKFKWQVKCYNILYRSIDSRSHLDGICSCWASHLVGALKFPWTFESHVLFDFEPLSLFRTPEIIELQSWQKRNVFSGSTVLSRWRHTIKTAIFVSFVYESLHRFNWLSHWQTRQH